MNIKYHTTDTDFSRFVQESYSIAEVLRKCNIIAAGGNYSVAKQRIARLGLNTSHFTGKLHSKGKKLPGIDASVYLNSNRKIQSNKLRIKLLNAGILARQCSGCSLTTWMDKEIPLELHHIDGDRDNNNLINLALLCPNCHAQTSTYRGKNIKKTK